MHTITAVNYSLLLFLYNVEKDGGIKMSIRSYYRRILIMILIASVIYTIHFGYEYVNDNIPDTINIQADSESSLDLNLPVAATISSNDCEVALKNKSGIPANQIKITTNDKVSFRTGLKGKYKINVKLLGLFNIKNIQVNVIENIKVIPCGCPIGIYLETDGIMIIGTGTVDGMDGISYDPAEKKVKSGDYIVSLNDIPVSSKSQLVFLVNKYGNAPIILGIRRNGEKINVKVNAVATSSKEYKMGIWVRDNTQGIGTLTYIDEHNNFGSLGHGISDVDTGQLLSSENGILYHAEIWGIKKGKNGIPGGLCGVINYEDSSELGKITKNTDEGVFGKANESLRSMCNYEPLNIGLKQDVKIGDAKIRCMLEDEIKEYNIKIVNIDRSNDSKNKGMIIQITDPQLLSITNGIVQGMSGSPIIQNGKLIGAVTHVFVNDPTKGYGIFVESMLEQG